MASRFVLAASAALAIRSVTAQQPGSTPENHPALTTYKCTTSGGCVAQKTSLVIDWGNHKLEQKDGSACPVSNTSAVCYDDASCNANCVVQGIDYATAGVHTSGDAVTLNQYVSDGNGGYNSASPRVYLLDSTGQAYEDVKLNGQELTYDVELSTLPCGENGALYLSEMAMTGGKSATNPGAAYGGGYCDAQCPKLTWFNGTVNNGNLGACCNEMDIWEANGRATGLTPHPCDVVSIEGCDSPDTCGFTGVCDQWGCNYNPYAVGQPKYYGAGPDFVIDTTKKFTVNTRFVTDDGTTSGTLIDVQRSYMQDGKVITNAVANASSGWEGIDSITTDYCNAGAGETKRLGGLEVMGEALERGMVLIFSIWNSAGDFMNWMDSGNAGPCNATEGDPKLILANQPDTHVTWSNVRWGDIGSTFPRPGSGSGSNSSSSSTVSSKTSTSVSSSTSKSSSTTSTSVTSSTSQSSSATKTTTVSKTSSATKTSATTSKTSSATKTSSTKTSSATKSSSKTVKPPPTTTSTKPAEPTQTHYGQCGGKDYKGPTKCVSPYTCKKANDYYSQCL